MNLSPANPPPSPTLLVTVNVHGLGPEAASEKVDPEALYGRLAHGRYAYRIGLARLLDAFVEFDIKATLFWPSREARVMPELFERSLEEGHEIANHGRAFEDHMRLSADEEADIIGESHEALTRLSGAAPKGFRAPTGTLSDRTIGLLAGLGYTYDSSFVDDDAPYPLAADGGASMIELPWSEGLSDATHFSRRLTQDRAEAFLTEEFDALAAVDGYACLTLHPRADIGLARTARLPILRRLLERARGAGLKPALCRDLAEAVKTRGSRS
jgi:peptidoglycan/xylan/chitin deacetylase (PgdA/CDA1 family)